MLIWKQTKHWERKNGFAGPGKMKALKHHHYRVMLIIFWNVIYFIPKCMPKNKNKNGSSYVMQMTL